jgi:GNAT superfamily N-acetyltransferase
MADQWLGFMDGAFDDNPEWAGCYCAFYDHTGPTWDSEEPGFAERNRANRRDTIEAGNAAGLVAVEDGEILGWLNAAPRDMYASPRRYGAAAEPDDPPTGSIMCFVVSPDHRGKGVAKALLAAADDHFRALGLEVAEAYPPVELDPDEPFTTAYKGTRKMYEDAGYAPVRDIKSFTVMRKSLT